MFLCSTLALLASPAAGPKSPDRRNNGTMNETVAGRIGPLCRKTSGQVRKIAWRAHERFVMCSTFKASLAALHPGQRRSWSRLGLDELIAYGPDDLMEKRARSQAELGKKALCRWPTCVRRPFELSDNTCAKRLCWRASAARPH